MTTPENPDRRDFLTGQSARDAITDKLADKDGNLPIESVLNDRQTGYVEEYSKSAMACEFELLFNLHQYKQSSAAALAAFQLIDDLEDQLTVYRDHSDVSQLNRFAARQPMVVEENLFELVRQAIEIHRETGAAFDITSGQLSTLWGFDRRSGAIPDQELINAALANVGSQFIQLDESERAIKIDREGVKINLGGIGKGHALDRVADLITSQGIEDFVIHGGQSSVLARGSSLSAVKSSSGSSDAPDCGWRVGLSHPLLPEVRLCEVVLRDRSLGTSGTGRQGFYSKGIRYGHIIDPRTGWPSSHFLSTTVISPSAALSDALATAFFVMPLEEVQQYCANHTEVAAVCVSRKGKIKNQIELHVFNLNDDDWLQADGVR